MSIATTERTPRHGLAAILASCAVLAVVIGFYVYAVTSRNRTSRDDYQLEASFLSSNGLHSGADVLLAGVPVGAVTAIELDPRSMTSRVQFVVPRTLNLPIDTKVAIGSSTLTSANALMVMPGKLRQILKPGAIITDTCELASLEQQVSQYIFGSGGAPSGCGS